jgi:hypothetical protein
MSNEVELVAQRLAAQPICRGPVVHDRAAVERGWVVAARQPLPFKVR